MAEVPALPRFFSQAGMRNTARLGARRSDIMFALAVVGIISVLVLPIAPILLDLLLGVSITVSVLILMTALFVNKPLELSAFPTILLISTMLRLALNIATTRLILSEGQAGPDAAGHVIEAFSGFVTGGSVLIGFIVFGILTIINFVVITKGSGRIAEVGARFSLDAMPGKQMAIDADLSAGLIDDKEAKRRRKELEDESTFYGAMDGASKFVRGDAVAGLLITFINLVGGMVIGIIVHDLPFGGPDGAVQTYTKLSIGDGLVSQIPALIISIAAGILVTKAGVEGSSEKAVIGQLSRVPTPLAITSGLLFLFALLPGIPKIPFFLLSGLMGYLALYLQRTAKSKKATEGATAGASPAGGAATSPGAPGAPAPVEEKITETLQIDHLRLELGYGLLPLINYQKGHRLTEQIKALRKQIARELGFVMPPVRIQDNMQLPANSYVIKVKEVETARGDIRPDMLLVMDPAGNKITLPGEETVEPTFGLPAMWVTENYREEALFRNYTVVDPPTVVTTHLTEVVKENMADMLSYAETQKLLDDLGKEEQKLISETVPGQISVSGVQRVLQNLLAEMVSIRDLPSIMEAVAESSRVTQNVQIITEHVRMRLARQISHANTIEEGYISILALAPNWEQSFIESLSGEGDEKILSMPPSRIQDFITTVRQKYDQLAMQGENPVLLTSPAIRPYVRSIVERFRPQTVVLSQNEIHPKARIKTVGQVA